jgi:hypothetical protein
MKVTPVPQNAREKLMNLWMSYKAAENNFQNYSEALCIGLGLQGNQFLNMNTFNYEDRNQVDPKKDEASVADMMKDDLANTVPLKQAGKQKG